jgi:hypothetical protein
VAVFIKDQGQRPGLDLSEAADNASGTVLSLVTVNKNGMVATVQDNAKSCGDFFIREIDKRHLVTGHANLKVFDAILPHKLIIFGRVGLGHQSNNALQFKFLKIGEVFRLWETAPIDKSTVPNHGKVGGGSKG